MPPYTNQSASAKASNVWCRPICTIPRQFVHVHAPAAYGSNMLSGELVSWPGLLSLGTDGTGPRRATVLLKIPARLPLTLALPVCLVASFPAMQCQDLCACLWTQIGWFSIEVEWKRDNLKKKMYKTLELHHLTASVSFVQNVQTYSQ